MIAETRKNYIWLSACTLVLVTVVAFLLSVRHGFLLEQYPWVFPDSFDWLVNGMAYASLPEIDINHRPILYPLIVALFEKINLSNYVQLYGTIAFLAGGLVLLWCGYALASVEVGSFATICYVCSAKVLSQSAVVAADGAAAMLISLSAFLFLLFLKKDNRYYLIASLVVGAVSTQAQYLIVVIAPLYIAFFFATSQQGMLSITTKRFAAAMRSWQIWVGATFAGILLLAILSPRLMKFGILYEERVAHVSLIKPSFELVQFYALALPGYFSCPILLLACLGSVLGLRNTQLKSSTLFMTLWAISIAIFFSCLYSYSSVRFAVYLAAPVFTLTGIALTKIYQRALSSNLRRMSFGLTLIAVLLFALLADSDEPYSASVILTPWHYVKVLEDGSSSIETKTLLPYHYLHATGAKEYREVLKYQLIDSTYVSHPLFELAKEIGRGNKARRKRIVVYEPQNAGELYVTRGRNLIYFRAPVDTVRTAQELQESVSRGSRLLVLRSDQAEEATGFFEDFTATPYKTHGPWRSYQLKPVH